MKFQILHNSSKQYHWRLVASNALVIAVGLEYGSNADCRIAIGIVVAATAGQFDVYQDFQQLWRWRLRSPTGQVVAISGETYVTRKEAADSVAMAAGADANTIIEELHDSGAVRAARQTHTSS